MGEARGRIDRVDGRRGATRNEDHQGLGALGTTLMERLSGSPSTLGMARPVSRARDRRRSGGVLSPHRRRHVHSRGRSFVVRFFPPRAGDPDWHARLTAHGVTALSVAAAIVTELRTAPRIRQREGRIARQPAIHHYPVTTWRRRESKTSVNPDASGACTDSRALAATFVRSGRLEFVTVGSVWATGGQGIRGPARNALMFARSRSTRTYRSPPR